MPGHRHRRPAPLARRRTVGRPPALVPWYRWGAAQPPVGRPGATKQQLSTCAARVRAEAAAPGHGSSPPQWGSSRLGCCSSPCRPVWSVALPELESFVPTHERIPMVPRVWLAASIDVPAKARTTPSRYCQPCFTATILAPPHTHTTPTPTPPPPPASMPAMLHAACRALTIFFARATHTCPHPSIHPSIPAHSPRLHQFLLRRLLPCFAFRLSLLDRAPLYPLLLQLSAHTHLAPSPSCCHLLAQVNQHRSTIVNMRAVHYRMPPPSAAACSAPSPSAAACPAAARGGTAPLPSPARSPPLPRSAAGGVSRGAWCRSTYAAASATDCVSSRKPCPLRM